MIKEGNIRYTVEEKHCYRVGHQYLPFPRLIVEQLSTLESISARGTSKLNG